MGAQIKKTCSIARGEYNHLRNQCKNNANLGLIFQVTAKLLRVTVRPLTYQTRVKFFENILIGNVHSYFQVIEGSLPLKSIIIKQRIPDNLVCFLRLPLDAIENDFFSLTPNNPRKATHQEKLNVTEGCH